jgi:ankyrin repeat protein
MKRTVNWTPGASVELAVICLIILAILAEPRVYELLSGRTPEQNLIEAAMQGNPATLDDALAEGADANTRDGAGNSALLCAVLTGQVIPARHLLESGANPNMLNITGLSPLMLAAQQDNAAMIQLLLAYGADPTLRSSESHATALQMAQNASAPKAVEILKRCQARGDARD